MSEEDTNNDSNLVPREPSSNRFGSSVDRQARHRRLPRQSGPSDNRYALLAVLTILAIVALLLVFGMMILRPSLPPPELSFVGPDDFFTSYQSNQPITLTITAVNPTEYKFEGVYIMILADAGHSEPHLQATFPKAVDHLYLPYFRHEQYSTPTFRILAFPELEPSSVTPLSFRYLPTGGRNTLTFVVWTEDPDGYEHSGPLKAFYSVTLVEE